MLSRVFGKPFILLLALMVVFAGALGASTKLCPLPEPVTEESYTWDFPAEVTETLADFEREARIVKQQVISLQALTRFPTLYSRASHGTRLMLARSHVNGMGDELCRLLEIRRLATPWQQETIDQLKVTLTALVNDTEAAIDYLNEGGYRTELSMDVYREYLDGMYRQADALCHCSDETWAEDVVEERR